jgi:hypothetical protein
MDGVVDGLDVIDFPGVDDRDETISELAELLLVIAQVVVFVVDYRLATCTARRRERGEGGRRRWVHERDGGGMEIGREREGGRRTEAGVTIVSDFYNLAIFILRFILQREYPVTQC